jgi:hypothetical protein
LGARGGDASWSSRGGAAWGSPEFGVLGVPGLKTTRVWVGRDKRDTRDPLGPRARVGDGRSVELGGGGGAAAAEHR